MKPTDRDARAVAARQAVIDWREGRGAYYSGPETDTYLAVMAALEAVPGQAAARNMPRVPKDFPVRPLTPKTLREAKDPATCGTCGRSWDDAVVTAWTPAPSARCPFEYFHNG